MLTGYDIVYFAPGKWDELWRDRHEITSVFARRNRVLFVERQHYLRPALTAWAQGEWRQGREGLSKPPVREVVENLFVFRYPPWAPKSGRFPLAQITQTAKQLSIQRTMRSLRMREPIAFFSRPSMIEDSVGEMRSARLLIYHVVDEYTGYDNVTEVSRRRILAREREMMSRVDLVFVVSQELYNAKSPFNPDTYLIPNGVNVRAYGAALADPELPEDLRSVKCPRLGYSGLIGDRLDLAMLHRLAQEQPEWSFVFLGEVRLSRQKETWQTMLTMPNVHYLGLAEIAQVPHYVKGFDIGLIPYALDIRAINSCPMKLYDYMAVGLPVASVDIPAVHEFASYIHIGNGAQGFGQAIRDALADAIPERNVARRHVAARHSWEARVERMSELIEARLEVKAKGR